MPSPQRLWSSSPDCVWRTTVAELFSPSAATAVPTSTSLPPAVSALARTRSRPSGLRLMGVRTIPPVPYEGSSAPSRSRRTVRKSPWSCPPSGRATAGGPRGGGGGGVTEPSPLINSRPSPWTTTEFPKASEVPTATPTRPPLPNAESRSPSAVVAAPANPSTARRQMAPPAAAAHKRLDIEGNDTPLCGAFPTIRVFVYSQQRARRRRRARRHWGLTTLGVVGPFCLVRPKEEAREVQARVHLARRL